MTEKPLINILLRTSNRPFGFKKALASIVSQDYEPIRIIISYDNDEALRYIPKGLEVVRVHKQPDLQFGYDDYCNTLKALVTDGWYCWLDDDDILMPNVLSQIVLDAPIILVQLNRNGNIVPQSESLQRGKVGMPCVLVHHSLKDVANVSPNGQGDYYYIKELQEKVGLKFVPIIMVYSSGRGLGRCNG